MRIKSILIIMIVLILVVIYSFYAFYYKPLIFAKEYLLIRYDNVSWENIYESCQKQKEYYSNSFITNYSRFGNWDNIIRDFTKNKITTQLTINDIYIVELKKSLFIIKADYTVNYSSDINEYWHQQTEYNVDIFVKKYQPLDYKIEYIRESKIVDYVTDINHSHEEHEYQF